MTSDEDDDEKIDTDSSQILLPCEWIKSETNKEKSNSQIYSGDLMPFMTPPPLLHLLLLLLFHLLFMQTREVMIFPYCYLTPFCAE